MPQNKISQGRRRRKVGARAASPGAEDYYNDEQAVPDTPAAPSPDREETDAPSRPTNPLLLPKEQRALQATADLIHSILNVPVAIWLMELDNRSLRIRAAHSLSNQHVKRAVVQLGDGSIISEIVESGEARSLTDIWGDASTRLGHTCQSGWVAMRGLPIKFRGRTCGVLEILFTDGQRLSTAKLDKLNHLSEIISDIVENVYLSREARELARVAHDLNAAQQFEKMLQVLVKGARRLTGADSSVLFILDQPTDTFVLGARTPDDEHTARHCLPRPQGGQTRRIVETGESVKFDDISQESSVSEAVIKQGDQSLIGVRVQLEDGRVGVLYVNGRRKFQFRDEDLDLLKTLAHRASLALGSARLLLIEEATSNLFNLEGVLQEVCHEIKASEEVRGGAPRFDFVAIQLLRHTEWIIETVYATGIAGEWSGVAKHYLEKRPQLRDIQADIVLSNPPRTEIIGGWDDRLDVWLFQTFKHDKYVRVFTPIIVLRDERGNIVQDWFPQCEWEAPTRRANKKIVKDEQGQSKTLQGWTVAMTMRPPQRDAHGGKLFIEVLGTVEVGYGDGFNNPAKEPTPAQAQSLARLVAQQAVDIAHARLPYLLETIVERAIRLVGADSGSLHFNRDPRRQRYIFEVAHGQIAHGFPKVHSPRQDGLGQQALREGKPQFVPGPVAGQRSLKLYNPQVYKAGIKAMAAFPLFVGERYGVLYIHFHEEHQFTEDEISWVQLFVNRATDALRNYVKYRHLRERTRQLTSLHAVVQRLVSEPEEKDLLRHIAWNMLNTLAADVVTIYEYEEKLGTFVTPPKIAGRLIESERMNTNIRADDVPALMVKEMENVYAPRTSTKPIFNKSLRTGSVRRQPFVTREDIKSSAGILLKVGKELVGVMFINYRRFHKFPEEEKQIIDALASAAAIAIKNRRLLEMLDAGYQKIITAGELSDVLTFLAESASTFTVADLCVISLVEPVSQELVIEAAYPADAWIDPKWRRVKLGTGITGSVAVSKQAALVNDLGADPDHEPYFAIDGSALCVPMQTPEGRVLGVLYIISYRKSAFTHWDQRVLEAIANQAVIAVLNAESRKQLVAANITADLGDFGGNLMHWINKRVGAIKHYAEEIRTNSGADRQKIDNILSVVKVMSDSAKRMTKWVGDHRQHEVDLGNAIDIAAASLIYPGNIIQIDINLPADLPKVCGDGQRLAEVFINLFDNAIDAMMPDGGTLTISGRLLPQEGKPLVMILVKDTGVGIPEDKLEDIFKPGESQKQSSAGGLGFGLWWSRNYIERLGGRMTVASKQGQGTEFTLLLQSC